MEKRRIQITVLNPGFEGTANALGALVLDFEDQQAYDIAMQTIYMQQEPGSSHTLFISNEKKETISWDPRFYHTMWTGPFDEWDRPSWLLPPEGTGPTPDS